METGKAEKASQSISTSTTKATSAAATPFRTAYGPHVRVTLDPVGESLTQQNFAPECEINNIMAKYVKTGLIDHVAKYGGYYGELPASVDLQENMNHVLNAQAMFMDLPAEIRAQFENDPMEFLEFAQDPENEAEMVEMGLLNAKAGHSTQNGSAVPPEVEKPSEVQGEPKASIEA